MAGLYTKKNLGEVQLNLKDALQKLYKTGIQEDLRLFAFSNSLFSEIRSGTVKVEESTGNLIDTDNEIYGFVNQPFTNESGQVINRTKFITNSLTFSSNNEVYINDLLIPSASFDRRVDKNDGAPIVFSENGSIVNVTVIGSGSKYEIRDSDGNALTGDNTISVYVRGLESGSENAIVELVITSTGSISKLVPPVVIQGGSGYLEGEALEIITQCRTNRFGQQETPTLTKCRNYPASGNRLYHISYDVSQKEVGYKALLGQSKYLYLTKDADEEGFFLFDEKSQKWVYLGDFYDAEFALTYASSPSITLRRYDTVTSLNILNLTSLDSRSHLFNYQDSFSVADNLGSQLRSLSNEVQSIKDSFKYLLQNNKKQLLVTEDTNTLGTQYNIFEGRNFDSTFRLIIRDPDGVVDRSDIEFVDLRTLENPDEVELEANGVTYHVPGIYINVGGLYKRAFSTDDKPFLSSRGKSFISPLLDKISGSTNYNTGSFVPRAETGENKYSISTAYLRPGGEILVGFDTTISTLVQNISSSSENGGFVFHRGLSTPVVNTGSNVKGWPLFSYDYNGATYSPVILAYT